MELTGDNDVGLLHLGDPVHGGDDDVQEDDDYEEGGESKGIMINNDYEDTAIPSTNAFRDFTC